MAKGFAQVKGLIFHESFTPIMKITTVCCLLTVTLTNDWELHQMSVNNIFLYGELDKDVYMRFPPGYLVPLLGQFVGYISLYTVYGKPLIIGLLNLLLFYELMVFASLR